MVGLDEKVSIVRNCFPLLMSKNLKLKKVIKSFVPEQFRVFQIPIRIWTLWMFDACEYLGRIFGRGYATKGVSLSDYSPGECWNLWSEFKSWTKPHHWMQFSVILGSLKPSVILYINTKVINEREREVSKPIQVILMKINWHYIIKPSASKNLIN